MKGKRSLSERLLSLALAVLMIFGLAISPLIDMGGVYAAEPIESITIEAPSSLPYKGEEWSYQFKAVDQDNNDVTEMVQWSCTVGTITKDGNYSISAEQSASSESIKITAKVSDSVNAEYTFTVQEHKKMSVNFVVKDSVTDQIIEDVSVTATPESSVMNAIYGSVSATTPPSGWAIFRDIRSGVKYTISISKNGYETVRAPESKSWIYKSGTTPTEFTTMKKSGNLTVSPTNLSMTAGDVEKIIVEYPDAWGAWSDCTVSSSDDSIIKVTKNSDKTVSVEALKKGSAKITVKAYEQKEIQVTVSAVTADSISKDVKVFNQSGIAIDADNKIQAGEKAAVKVKLTNNKKGTVITDGSMTFTLQRQEVDADTGSPKESWEDVISSSAVSAGSDGYFTWDIGKIAVSGNYRVKYSYTTTSGKYDNFEGEKAFTVEGLEGQSITISQESKSFGYDDAAKKNTVNFEAVVAADASDLVTDKAEAIKDAKYWTVSDSADILTNETVEVSAVTAEDGMYKVTGTVTFGTKAAGKTDIVLGYKDSTDYNALVYVPAEDKISVEVTKKTLTVDTIGFADNRIYDGTKDIKLGSVTLGGIVNSDAVYVETGSKVYTLADSNVTVGGVSLNVDAKNGGTAMVLTGANAGNYELDLSNIGDFKCDIIPAVINVDLSGLTIEKDYYTENPDIEAIVKANAAKVFSGFIKTDNKENLLKAITESYMPQFTTEANKESGVNTYDIKASNPAGEKPEALNNYQFDLSGTVVGQLVINERAVSLDDYSLSTNSIYPVDGRKTNIWVKKNTTNKEPIIPNDGSGYDAVVYCDAKGNAEDPDFTVASGSFYFKLKNSANGSLSKAMEITYTTDDKVSASVEVTANNGKSTSDKIISALTLGIFGNKDDAKAVVAGSDDQSGIASVQYVKTSYDEIQPKTEEEIKALLDAETAWQGDNNADAKNITFEEGRQIIFVRVIDNVGNVQYAGSNGIIIDSQKPDFVSAVIKNYRENGVYNENVTISYEATDIIEGVDSFSGVKEIKYQAYLNGEAQTADGWSDTFSRDYVTSEKTAAGLKANENAVKFTGDFTIPYEGVVSTDADAINHVTVKITAVDYAGNEYTANDIEFDYDVAAPVLTVSFDGEPKNDSYFNADRTVTVLVTDAYFKRSSYGSALFTGTDLASPAEGYESGWKDLGDYTYEMKYCYSIDADHTFDVSITDGAGNTSKMADDVPENYRAFTVDQTSPVITSVKYYMYVGENKTEISEQVAKKERYYGNDKIYAELTVEEHNFEDRAVSADYVGGLALDIKAENSQGKAVAADTSNNWTTNVGDTHVLRVNFNGDANYTFDLNYTDKAGNELNEDYKPDYFTVDTVVPSGKIKISNYTNPWSAIVNVITFGIFSNKNETVTLYDEYDETAGVQKVSYIKSHDQMTVSSLDNAYAAGKWTDGKSLTISPNQQCIVYGRIEDKSGNYYYISTDGFVLDDKIDKPQIDIVTPEPLNHIYNSNVNVKIKVVDPDPTGNHDYAGLKSVYYEVRKDGSVTQSGYLSVTAGAARQQSVEDIITVNAEKNNSNNVQVYVKAVDNAENVSEQTLDMKIDITKPTINVTFDNNAPLNGKYYKSTRTATVVITERNFDPNNVQINITNTDGTMPSISGWSAGGAAGTDSATHTAQIVFSADGDYNFTVDCTDLALNKAEAPYKAEEFTIDKTQPKIAVSYDNNSAQNGNYYKAARTATITITEHNFNASDVKVSTTANNGASAPTVSGWSTSGDRHTATVRFASDADYTFDIDYADLAGNAAADYAMDKFTVDLTNPELEISGVKNKSANKGTVAPTITMSDTNYTAQGVTVTLTGANKGKINIDSMISRTSSANGQTISFKNFSTDMDDIYTLSAKIIDKAGNETSKSITFSVNRNGSTYIISDATQKLMDTGFTNTPQDIVISEVNVDTLEFVELSYTKDGQVVKLKEGTDYTIKEEGGNGQWKKYTYTIKASCFEEEGQYSINIYSEDRAQNTTTNAVKKKGIEFVVDKTAPTLVVSNLDNRGRYKEDVHEFTLTVKDNTALAYVELYLDGKLVKTYEGDELVVEDGVIKINVDSKNGYQNVKLIAYDAAGNPTDPVEYDVLVTSNWWIQFYMNKPLFFGVIAGIVVVAGIIIFLIAKRRKDDEKARV